MRIRKGDKVKVIAGNKNIKGKVGEVLSIDRESRRVVIDGGEKNKCHIKPERDKNYPEGGIVEKARSIHVSNVMVIPEGSDRPVRIGIKEENGDKIRVARGKSGQGAKI